MSCGHFKLLVGGEALVGTELGQYLDPIAKSGILCHLCHKGVEVFTPQGKQAGIGQITAVAVNWEPPEELVFCLWHNQFVQNFCNHNTFLLVGNMTCLTVLW